MLFFLLGLDGDGLYQAPFPNDEYAKLQQALQHPLHGAVLRGNADSVQRELANGHDLALPTATGYTSLLLAAGADGDAVDHDGNTPLIYAGFTGSTAAAQALIAHGVNLYETNR